MKLTALFLAGTSAASPELLFKDKTGQCLLSKVSGDTKIESTCDLGIGKHRVGSALDALYATTGAHAKDIVTLKKACANPVSCSTPCCNGAGSSTFNGHPIYCVAKGAMLTASIHNTANKIWQGGFDPRSTTGGLANPVNDYVMSFKNQKAIIDKHGGDLVTEIHLEGGSKFGTSYEITYNGWKWTDATFNRYTFNGGSCMNPTSAKSTCAGGKPMFQHVDTANWYSNACCCSANNAWGYYGGCGFSQWGTKVDAGHGNMFAHNINMNGQYVNPPSGPVAMKLFYFKFANFETPAVAHNAKMICNKNLNAKFPRFETVNLDSHSYFGAKFASKAQKIKVWCVGHQKVLVTNVKSFEASSIWGAGQNPKYTTYGSPGSDYLLALDTWRKLISAYGTANLRTVINGPDNTRSGHSGTYSLVYNDFQLDSSFRYRHNRGSCPNGSCGSGPQWQHNDPRTMTWTGSLYDKGACCCSSNSAWGWYGGCGFSQFGSKVDAHHGNTRAHNVNPDGNYVNPPVTGVDSKQFYLEFTAL